ncbi:MAG: flagellar biosynthesis anti-sigma factor FlgM [Planctomycetota bacterium]
MNVQGTGGVQGPQPIPPRRNAYTEQAQAAPRPVRADRADISEHARWLQKLAQSSDIRQEKVDSIRSQIEAGTYDTDDKLQIAIDRLLDDLR